MVVSLNYSMRDGIFAQEGIFNDYSFDLIRILERFRMIIDRLRLSMLELQRLNLKFINFKFINSEFINAKFEECILSIPDIQVNKIKKQQDLNLETQQLKFEKWESKKIHKQKNLTFRKNFIERSNKISMKQRKRIKLVRH